MVWPAHDRRNRDFGRSCREKGHARPPARPVILSPRSDALQAAITLAPVQAEVILVRHAGSIAPVPGGPEDFQRWLTAHGLVQAERLAERLAAYEPAQIVSSPYLRAVQTVAPVARRLGRVVVDVELREWTRVSAAPGLRRALRRELGGTGAR
jgi:hypothetical protein